MSSRFHGIRTSGSRLSQAQARDSGSLAQVRSSGSQIALIQAQAQALGSDLRL